MGYLDRMADRAFKKSKDGEWIYYPWGILGSGYIVSDEEKHEKARKFIRRQYEILMLAIIVCPFLQHDLGMQRFIIVAVCCIAIYQLWYYFFVKRQVRGLVRSDDKLLFREVFKDTAKHVNLFSLIFLEIFSLIFAGGGLWMLVTGADTITALSNFVIFSLCAIFSGFLIAVKIKSKSSGEVS